jgi:hypothetical protein
MNIPGAMAGGHCSKPAKLGPKDNPPKSEPAARQFGGFKVG